ncbi:MarR family transcriptional regulator [Fructobacillus evanidus]|uniref:MarR family (MarR) n=1 Tax=Fructobacillus evanidus TaxID=3064281 RepID=A0ABN9YWE1_9LACO|nr:DNA-binding transcriptional regulator [Fructobacillus sp. LMG 32999]CAK1242466.1 DNA-binding transcriptional regulator [Fructobacillus sp. LMG 32999]CAK1247937.1 DNA-binding transcriptional regulator [Fructobacillus sp. LMG 32999]CAK1249269.1 DNA-binding transcriptional regulator [Fructobacillus sp. LMG 32999]CAK1249927.1 DNA-binding transcriptional regulator [Fructobacillus sp. LMG 32999]
MEIDQKLPTIFFAYQEFASLVDLSQYDLTQNQHRMLFIISSLEDVNIKKILVLIGISKQAANVAIRDLMEKGLVTEHRSTVDKRVKYLQLTPEGIDLNDQINLEQKRLLDRYFDEANGDWEKAMTKLAQKYLDRVK